MTRAAWPAAKHGTNDCLSPTRIAGLLAAAMLFGAAPRPASAADGLEVTLPEAGSPNLAPAAADPPVSDPPASYWGGADLFAGWQGAAERARATQPEWASPLVTTSGLLEQRLRFDVSRQHAGNGTDSSLLDGGKGLDLIVNQTTDIRIAAAPYVFRSGAAGSGGTQMGGIAPLAGFGDWPLIRVAKRLFSNPASDGGYVVTALLQILAPSGIERLTNNAWQYMPALAFGKGWGDVDIQGTLGGVIPASRASAIGYQVQSSMAFQYRVARLFWPEVEVAWTYYANGQRGGLNQVYLIPGIVVGRFVLPNGLKFTFGVGYQAAVTPAYIPRPLTPAYNHAWLLTTRLNF